MSAKIYRVTDRIRIKIGDIVAIISPMSLETKSEIQAMMLEGQKAGDIIKLNNAMMLALRKCLKGVEGLTDANDNTYELQFKDGMVAESCLDDLTNMQFSPELLKVCAEFVNAVPKKFDIPGVEIIEKKKNPGE